VIQLGKEVHPVCSVPKVVVTAFPTQLCGIAFLGVPLSSSLGGRRGCIMNDRLGTMTILYYTYIGFGNLGRKIRIPFVEMWDPKEDPVGGSESNCSTPA
jgi:hypothetical protein